MEAVTIDGYVMTARAALHDAPPIGDPAYVRFAEYTWEHLNTHWEAIVEASAADVAAGRERGMPERLLRRIAMTEGQRRAAYRLIERLPDELRAAAAPSPVVIGPHGTRARRVPKPLGVLLMIYEARPSVTIDGSLLPVCAGNAVILRGGTEIGATNRALATVFHAALTDAGLPAGLVQVLTEVDRAGLRALLARDDAIDVLIPRGSPSLTDACRAVSRIPMILGGGGVNHLYVHADADVDLAVRAVIDGKYYEPEGCTALEAVLLDSRVRPAFWKTLDRYAGELSGITLRVDAGLLPEVPDSVAAQERTEADLGREYLDRTLCVHGVGDLDDAVKHIRRFGSGHTEAIITRDPAVADRFCAQTDAAAVIVNGSVRLHDAPTLGLGSEIAISTSRLHVRGPVTVGDLMSHGWRVDGDGALRFRTTETNA
jgi:glutamate-5-semialdehyde dehydrogenase